jgi:uncharacterized membrane protein YkvA (DUF1232 family)
MKAQIWFHVTAAQRSVHPAGRGLKPCSAVHSDSGEAESGLLGSRVWSFVSGQNSIPLELQGQASDGKPERKIFKRRIGADANTWKLRYEWLRGQIRLVSLLMKHPEVPWYGKVVAACTVGYIFSPIQLIPSFIPVIGQMDDAAVLYVGLKVLQKITPAVVLAECRQASKDVRASKTPISSLFGRNLSAESTSIPCQNRAPEHPEPARIA